MDEIYPIDPVTIGQFTGLHDRNGKEIYEGDIVQSIGTPELVQWKFFCEGDGNPVAGYCFTHGVEFVSENVLDCEVIGNVHDNPELVAEQQWQAARLREILEVEA
jgi:hypothetical protein